MDLETNLKIFIGEMAIKLATLQTEIDNLKEGKKNEIEKDKPTDTNSTDTK